MQKRNVLWCLLTFQLICNTLVSLNMSIAIISMVNTHTRNIDESNPAKIVCPNTTLVLRNFHTDAPLALATSPSAQGNGYNWSEAEQNMVLSGFHWLSFISILPGGILAHKFGSKRVVGLTQSIASIMSSLVPIFADHGPVVISWIRAIQGLLLVITAPAGLFSIISNWSPPEERGWFGTAFMVGISVGMAVGSYCFGYVAEFIHFRFIFHITSICGVIWAALWFKLVYDSPRQHPTISCEEKEYIESSLKTTSFKNKASIPWKRINTSVPVLVSILATDSGMWTLVMVNTYSPIYLKSMYGLNSNEIGIITSIPQFLAGIVGIGVGFFSDLCIKRGLFSLTNVRKLCTFIGCIIAAIPLIIVALTNCDVTVVIICLVICFIIRSFGNFGAALVILDISPTFCGVLEGLSGTSMTIQAFIFSSTINYFTGILEIAELWKYVFLLSALYMVVTNIIFLIFGTSEVRKWNYEHAMKPPSKRKIHCVDPSEKSIMSTV